MDVGVRRIVVTVDDARRDSWDLSKPAPSDMRRAKGITLMTRLEGYGWAADLLDAGSLQGGGSGALTQVRGSCWSDVGAGVRLAT